MRWVAPAFAQYDLGEQYTGWLYGDPQGNPNSYDDPALWPSAGYVQIQERTVTVALAAGSAFPPFDPLNSETINLDLTGGRNAILFSRYASVIPGLRFGGGIGQQLPTQTWAYIYVRQVLVEGYQEIQDTVLPNVFGTGWSPQIFPAPETWNDKLRRRLTVSNVGNEDVTIALTWKVAYLNTGA